MILSVPEHAVPIYAIPDFAIPFVFVASGAIVFEAFQANGSAIYSVEVFSGPFTATEITTSDIYGLQIESSSAVGG